MLQEECDDGRCRLRPAEQRLAEGGALLRVDLRYHQFAAHIVVEQLQYSLRTHHCREVEKPW